MDNVEQLTEVRHKLFADQSLGAGNFFFKALSAYPNRDADYIYLEKEFIAPNGKVYKSFSLNSLYEVVKNVAAWYQNYNIAPKSFVCVFVDDGIGTFIHFLALNSLLLRPVLINRKINPSILSQYAKKYEFSYLVTDSQTWSENIAELENIKNINATFTADVETEVGRLSEFWPYEHSNDDIVMVCHSSGTTGIPKAVTFGHKQFFDGKRERLLSFIENKSDRLITAMPPTHAAGISYIMTATMLQLPCMVMSNQLGEDLSNAIKSFKPTVMTAFSQSYASLASLKNLKPGDFASLERFYNTGDTAHQAHIRRLLELAPNARFIDMFGSSELGMSQFYKTTKHDTKSYPRTVGHVASYAEGAILSPQGDKLGYFEVGYIGVKSPTITPGYLDRPTLSSLSRLNGYWLTGDIGLQRDNGEFIHLDRITDTINTPLGSPGYTLLIEEHILSNLDIEDVSVVGANRGPTRQESTIIFVKESDILEKQNVSLERILEVALSCYPFAGIETLPDMSVGVCLLSSENGIKLGATGKVIKHALKSDFWENYERFLTNKSSVIKDIIWNKPSHVTQNYVANQIPLVNYLKSQE